MQGLDKQRVECPVVVLENCGHDPSDSSYINCLDYQLAFTIEYNYILSKP
jgi:hypothetical protein